MSCSRFDEKLSAYLDGELDYQQRAELERHLLECPRCSGQLDEMRRIESFRPLLEPPEVPQEKWRECWDEIKKQTTDSLSLEEVKARVARRRQAHWLRRAGFAFGGVAVAVLVIAVIFWPAAPAPDNEVLALPPAGRSVRVNCYDEEAYSLCIDDKPEYAIIKLVPIQTPAGG
jgi:anti-sigma factor RsiW